MTSVATEEIFDASSYDLPIPRLDGYKADNLVLNIGGAITLDRTSEEDLAFIDTLSLGSEVTLQVVATVTKKGFTLAPGRDENPETTGYGVGLKVHTVAVA